MKTLVLGGYGNFGARISRALAGDPAIELLIGGRDAVRAESFARTLAGARAFVVDHRAPDFAGRLAAEGIGIVIHTAGPFQGQDYAVARAAATAGAHYVDLADGRQFVCDFAAELDAPFRAAGRRAVSGASTLPALSSAVVDSLCEGWRSIDVIDICIAPAQSAPRGLATLESVLSYCGAPIRLWRGGAWHDVAGWSSPSRVTFHRMTPRLGAVCDVPDLELFPAHYRVGDAVAFRAALELRLAQLGFAAIAAVHRWGLLAQPQRLARFVLNASRSRSTVSAARSAACSFACAGRTPRDARSPDAWHIAADDDHGPEIRAWRRSSSRAPGRAARPRARSPPREHPPA